MNEKLHRISAGGIVIHNDKVLLVRYSQGYLVAPGGGLNEGESLQETAIREIFEETSINVIVKQPIMVELIISNKSIHSKTWFSCKVVSGEISETKESIEEGIVACGWYDQSSLKNELVFPSILKTASFEELQSYSGSVIFPDVKYADF